jgi:hypothetical protein
MGSVLPARCTSAELDTATERVAVAALVGLDAELDRLDLAVQPWTVQS